MRRMSSADEAPELLALEGAAPAGNIDELMAAEGLVLVLAGLRYPGNVGFILRSAEVAGAAGVVLSSDWQGSQREEAMRIGIRADRFLPIFDADVRDAIGSARASGRRVVALETSGTKVPWQVDLSRPTAVLVGGETEGLSPALVEAADDVVRIPSRGFMPSYNVQAAVGVLLGEWLRQDESPPR